MKTKQPTKTMNYSSLSDDEVAKERMEAFLSDMPIKDRRKLNEEFAKRFPRCCNEGGSYPKEQAREQADPEDDTPSMFEEMPVWVKEGMKKKFSLKRNSSIPD